MGLSKEQIEHIAKLARLDLTDDEFEKYGSQLSNVLSYIEQLQEVDVNDAAPTAQVTGLLNVLREDEVREWDNREVFEALHDAPELEEEQIKVKRVLS